jgi:inhibitor of cysteine peptidase
MPGTIILTEHDDGRTIDLHVGQAVTVNLPENATTGYRWAIEQPDARLVEAREGKSQYPSNALGSAGRVEWVFLAKAPGTTSITLKQWRPWEGDASIVQRFRAQLHIVP